jgi:hypothetical protein
MTRKNRLEGEERSRNAYDTMLEYSAVGGMTGQAAYLKGGSLGYANQKHGTETAQKRVDRPLELSYDSHKCHRSTESQALPYNRNSSLARASYGPGNRTPV